MKVRWLHDGDLERDVDAEAVRYGPGPSVATKLDAYKPIIEARLTVYPELTARTAPRRDPRRRVRSWLLAAESIRASGTAAASPEPVIPFETPAGRQAQVDFARFRFDWGVRYALLVVLGYSRLLWCRLYLRQDMATLMDGLDEAFGYFGGVPQELLFDHMKAVTTRDLRFEGGALVRNAEFLRFAHHWGFTPRACCLTVGLNGRHKCRSQSCFERTKKPRSVSVLVSPALL